MTTVAASVEIVSENNKPLTLKIDDTLLTLDMAFTNGDIAVRELNEQNIESLATADIDSLPAIEVCHIRYNGKDAYVVVDGNHRVKNATNQGRTEIKAIAKNYASPDEVIQAAFKANMTHGLQASTENRSNYAWYLHLTRPELTQTDIARMVGLNQSSVQRAIASREKAAKQAAKEAAAQMVAEDEAATDATDIIEEAEDITPVFKKLVKAVLTFDKDTGDIETDADIVRMLEAQARKPEEAKDVLARVGQLLISASKYTPVTPKRGKGGKKTANGEKPVQRKLQAVPQSE